MLTPDDLHLLTLAAEKLEHGGWKGTAEDVQSLVARFKQPAAVPHVQDTPRESLGLIQKYYVERVDGSSAPGGRHHGCEYFVLDLTHDPYSVPAMVMYALAAGVEYPKLKDDILARYSAALPPIKPSGLEWMTELMAPYHDYRHGLKAHANFLSNYSLKPKE